MGFARRTDGTARRAARRRRDRPGWRAGKTEEDYGVRVRHVSRVSAHRRDDRRGRLRGLLRAGRCRRALGSRCDVAGRDPCRAGTLDILKQAWTEPSFSYKGKYYSFDNVKLTPKPYQKPWPEIRIAANSADTFPQIGKLGHGVFVAVRLGTLEELEPNITAYRKAWKEAGHPGEGKVFL